MQAFSLLPLRTCLSGFLSPPDGSVYLHNYNWIRRVCAKLLQSCPALCNLMRCSPPGSSVHGIIQARILEWVSMPSSRRSSWSRDRTCIFYISCIAGRFFTAGPPGSPDIQGADLKVGQSSFLCHYHHSQKPDLPLEDFNSLQPRSPVLPLSSDDALAQPDRSDSVSLPCPCPRECAPTRTSPSWLSEHTHPSGTGPSVS